MAFVSLIWGLAAYAPAGTAAAMIVLLVLLRHGLPLRLRAALLCTLIAGLVFYAAFATVPGFFWLNRSRLDTLVTQIQAVPAISDLELGDGKDYCFLNGKLISADREHANPHASQPRFYERDLLRQLGVPLATYQALGNSLARLSLGGYYRNPTGEIGLSERAVGGTPWVNSFLYSPNGSAPQSLRLITSRRLSAHWFYISEG